MLAIDLVLAVINAQGLWHIVDTLPNKTTARTALEVEPLSPRK